MDGDERGIVESAFIFNLEARAMAPTLKETGKSPGAIRQNTLTIK
jgi:hypothetical protein